jgi:predicted dehydrogenase
MKAALVGVGSMGSTHYNLLKKMSDVEIIALVDIEKPRTEEKARECGISSYTDIHDMMAHEKPDFVDICSPSYLHPEHAMAVMEKGIHVLTEKPAALKAKDLKAMLQCASDNNVMFMTAHVLRFWPEYVWLKNVTDSRQCGKLLHLRLWRHGLRPTRSWKDWMLDKEKSGLVPFDLHIHDIDFMVYLLGTPEKKDFFEINGSPGQYIETSCRYADGPRVLAKAAWFNSNVPFQMGYEAIFEGGYADYNSGKLVFYPNNGEPFNPVENVYMSGSESNVANASGYYNEIRYFIDCIVKNEKPSVVKGDELLTVLSLLENLQVSVMA